MSRYLTPSRIGLLALAFLYTEGVVPTSEATAILSFLISHIIPDPSRPPEVPTADAHHTVPITAFEAQLAAHSSRSPGRTIWDLFLSKIWSFNAADSLELFLSNLPSLLAKSREQLLQERESGQEFGEHQGHISRTSPLGAFIRLAHLEYTRLQFHDARSVWHAFLTYRLPTKSAWEERNPSDGSNSLDANFSDLHIDSAHPIAQIMYGKLVTGDEEDGELSKHDVDRLMEFQASELQRHGGRLPEEMRTKLGQMSRSRVPMPAVGYYLRFLDYWRAGDYSSSFDNLHRYFDYTMQSRDRTLYQYALLNLAILQADFGCYAEAIPAMREAISTSRENKDITCLNFCMCWLYHFSKAFPEETQEIRNSGLLGNEHEGLAYLKSRAKEVEMWSLLSSTLLSEAKLGLQNGGSIATAFESIAKATHLNVIKETTNMTGPILIMKAAVFSRVGLAHLAWSSAETFLECYADRAPAEELLHCHCRMATLLVQKGRYSEATELMEAVPRHVLSVVKNQQYWSFFAGMLRLRRHLHRSNFDAASYILGQLKGQITPDMEVGFALSLLEVDLLMRQGVYNEALDLVESLAKTTNPDSTDVYAHIKWLVFKARGLALCKRPLKGFSVAVRAANMANRARILPALWESAGILANILITLHEFAAAVDLLEAVMPQILECEDCDLAARTYALLVDGYMGLGGNEEPDSIGQEERVNNAMEYMDAALLQFEHVEDLRGQCDMLVKKATILNLRGDLVLANDCASRYLSLKKEYEAARSR